MNVIFKTLVCQDCRGIAFCAANTEQADCRVLIISIFTIALT